MSTSARPGWQEVAATLVAERGDALLRYAYLLSGSREDAADLVQDALVATFGRVRGDFTMAAAEAYVRRAVLNGFLDGTRRATKWRSIRHLAVVPGDADALASDDRLDVQGQLRMLSPRERACVVLRYWEDLPLEGIAERLGISAGTVKRYLSDAHAKLRNSSLGAALGPSAPTADRQS
jgi:RNA polymerase sigma factor (sigma-70 family)